MAVLRARDAAGHRRGGGEVNMSNSESRKRIDTPTPDIRSDVEAQVSHLELLAKQVREQGDVRQVWMDEEGVRDDVPTLADELWMISFNLRNALRDEATQAAKDRAEAAGDEEQKSNG